MDLPCSSMTLGEIIQPTNVAHLWQQGHNDRKNGILLDSDTTLRGWTITSKVYSTPQVRTINAMTPATQLQHAYKSNLLLWLSDGPSKESAPSASCCLGVPATGTA